MTDYSILYPHGPRPLGRPDAWDQNPWVVATTFTVHHCNIDKMSEEK